MKKPFLLLIILLLLSLLIYWYITHEPKGANIDRKDINVVVIETNLEINVEDVINAFNVTNRVYFHNKEEIPILNKVKPAAFYYLDGALLTYIFENEVECNKAVEFIHENFTDEKLLASRLVEFRQTDFEPIIYKVNNALVAYVPKYTIKTKMNRSVERVIFLKKAREKGLTKEMLNYLGNLGFSNQEILELLQAKIDTIFAPGTHLDGGGFDFSALSEEEQKELQKSGIDSYKSVY